ncbi:putative glutamate 5-kinase [Smittium mucronatum]|uniref:Putative glutamate 5-kinase n=1 Tax=Smittium mucronatum TaxID=133383 RepID=A0A1R0GZD8_9FUNG|nr:putative glutamate 5-kinase [Smittium mucronatum]
MSNNEINSEDCKSNNNPIPTLGIDNPEKSTKTPDSREFTPKNEGVDNELVTQKLNALSVNQDSKVKNKNLKKSELAIDSGKSYSRNNSKPNLSSYKSNSPNHSGKTPTHHGTPNSFHSSSRSHNNSSSHLNSHTEVKKLTIVLKLGSSSVCDPVTHVPHLSTLFAIVEVISSLKEMGHDVVLVSSGAVATGLRRLDLPAKPKSVAQKQAVAAVGQGRLMALYDNMFSHLDMPIAQVLITRNDLSHPTQYVNAYNTFMELLKMNVVPIVNENDTVNSGGIRFGDNDTLSAITAGMIHADYLFLLTDVDCLYTDNPRNNPDAKRVIVVDDMSKLVDSVDVSSSGSSVGTGGMATKLVAAELAMAAGVCTIITNSDKPKRIIDIIQYFSEGRGENLSSHNESIPESVLCTRFLPNKGPSLADRKWWIKHGMRRAGTLFIDYGALVALVKNKKSLFAAGIVSVEGVFGASQSVAICFRTSLLPKEHSDNNLPQVLEVGNGLVNYSSTEISRIKGHKSESFMDLLGYCDNEDVIHRGNIAINISKVDFNKLF